jgi:hypothetical protein
VTNLERLLRRMFRRMAPEYLRQMRAHVPSLRPWVPVLAEAVKPLLLPLWQAGARRSVRNMQAQIRQRARRKSYHSANLPNARTKRLSFGFDLFNQRIHEALDRAIFDFCESTLDTIQGEVETAYDRLREQLREGLEEGEAQRDLTARVMEIFADPDRAHMIAATETQRAVHGGQLLAAKESGIVDRKRWLASSDACPECLKLNGKEVDLDEPFYVDPKGGVYAVVQAPPKHPRCMCALIEVVNYDAVTDVGQPRMAGLALRGRLTGLLEDLV